ncbi:non-homologous end joining protein Ku [Cupriavidus pinatubonensis]|uniref:Non-homologous end joining protein Ku n=1 Tax=Cupriavidus pinatubonensis TaxID=248026 RepID=A0ABM8XZP2_9BURK|nr:Ku protein [Cupriavidus pinatubonensis]CAG9185915.1 Non-homologous end joining protein Ku [Cupriavidus pinatubonensis]
MAARSLASLSLSFGLVSIPVKLYTATDSGSTVRFNLLSKDGSRLKQQYVSEKTREVVPREEMVKGYEFEKDQFVIFSPDELKALEEGASHIVEIVSFVPEKGVDPIYYDKTYYIAPDKRGGKPYSLLRAAMAKTGRCAIAKWASKGKSHMVQIRPIEGGLVFQQLLFADEVRSIDELHVEDVAVSDAEMKLAVQLIEQASEDHYDASQYRDEEKERVLAAIDAKIAGKEIISQEPVEISPSGQVIDLVEALKKSLSTGKRSAAASKTAAAKAPAAEPPAPRKSAKRTTASVAAIPKRAKKA